MFNIKTTCGIFIIFKNEILICHPTNHSWDLWSIPKGVPDDGELFLDAAIREVKEETNITLSKDKNEFTELPVSIYKHKEKQLVSYVCMIEKVTEELICDSFVEPEGFPEVDEFRWVSFDEAERLLHYSQSAVINDVKDIVYGND